MPADVIHSQLSEKDSEVLTVFQKSLKPLFKNVDISSGEVKKNFFAVEHKNGKLNITIDTSKVNINRSGSYINYIIGYLDSLQSLGKIGASNSDNKQSTKFFENFKNGYYKFFYNFIYRFVSVHRTHIPAVHRQEIKTLLDTQLSKLERKYDPIPKHLQFLLAIAGKSVDDTQVQKIIQGLQDNNIISQLVDPRISEDKRLELIHRYILTQYEYFLSQDKNNWKNTKEGSDTIDQIIEKTKQDVEKINEDVTQNDSDNNKKESTEEDQENDDIPDYNRTYTTSEGGSMESGNKKNQGVEIIPGLKGYFVSDQKNIFDPITLKWTNTFPQQETTNNHQFSGNKYTFKASIASSEPKALPCPYGYGFDVENMVITGTTPQIYEDDVGNYFLQTSGKTQIEIDIYKRSDFSEQVPVSEDTETLFSNSLSPQAMEVLSHSEKHTDVRTKIRMIRDYITKHHFYPPGKNEKETMEMARKLQLHLQDISSGSDYFYNLDTSTHLECYSANALFVSMLRHVGIASRITTGHHVQSVAKNGSSYLSSSNGHGWVMVWDGSSWVRFDATPPKDPNDSRNKKDKNDSENEEDGEEQGTGGDNADDGGEDSPGGSDEGDGESGEGGEGSGEGSSLGESGEGGGEGGETTADYGDIKPNDDIQDDFEKMYKELGEVGDNGGTSDSEKQGESQDESANQEAKEFEKLVDTESKSIQEQEEKKENIDPVERDLRLKYPTLPDDEIQKLARFMKEFRADLETISQLENPLHREGKSDYKTLEEALRSIFDRVISRRIKEREVPMYPVTEGDVLIDPVTLYIDSLNGISESHSFQTTKILREEELRIVKVRKRKVLDASVSMDENKLRTQQQIEVLENKVTAEKQLELNDISERLARDLRLETETWQFGTRRSSSERFTLLKPLGSKFTEVEQSAIWNLARAREGGTNDFDPLIAIYESLERERKKEVQDSPYEMTTLERIRVGFLVREIQGYKKLESSTERTINQEKHFQNLDSRDPEVVKKSISHFIPRINDQIDRSMLSSDENDFIDTLKIDGKNTIEIFEEWLEVLKQKDPEMEPILEIIEVSSDGGSDNQEKLQEVLSRLRSLGVIVIAYGLGNDGGAVKEVYENDFNPDEGGSHCRNLLDYPRLKMQSWTAILDTI